jgi:membrane fusion protein, heavy metal efflux system
MTTQRIAILAGALGLVVGAGGMYFSVRKPAPAAPAQSETSGTQSSGSEHSVTLSPDAVVRAGVVIGRAEAGTSGARIRIPGIVAANAYHQAAVTSLVSGRLTKVTTELGQAVRRGDVLAVVYSPDLADAERIYLSGKAELDAHEQKLARTADLLKRGVASQQELEQAHAEHTMMTTTVEGARSRLQLLGLAPEQIGRLTSVSQMTATTEVRTPIDGVIVARQANPGVNVQSGEMLFTIADLSTVWLIGDLFEKDFQRVAVGSPVSVRITGYPDLSLHSTINYIDPQLNIETRTAKVRAEVANPRRDLRLGMFAEMVIDSPGSATVTLVPRSAVQTIGDQSVVYVPDSASPSRFVERRVETGSQSGDKIEIKSGIEPNESVVVNGSFFLRAEQERATPMAGVSVPAPAVQVTVSEKGFVPDHLIVASGQRTRIRFLRTTDKTCAAEVVFPSLSIRRTLPLNQPVDVEITPVKGELAFACGMGMFKGTITAQ